MDWKYKHFNQQAVFNAPIQSVLEAAREVVAGSFGQIEDTPDGFVARGHSARQAGVATFRAASAPTGTQLNVELLVERAGMRGYMLFDVVGYFNAQIDKWFSAIAQRLGQTGAPALVSKTTTSYLIQRGCLAGCAVWLVAATCLGVAATGLDLRYSPPGNGSIQGPFSIAAGTLAFLVGVATFLYVAYPDGPVAKFIRGLLPGHRDEWPQ